MKTYTFHLGEWTFLAELSEAPDKLLIVTNGVKNFYELRDGEYYHTDTQYEDGYSGERHYIQ